MKKINLILPAIIFIFFAAGCGNAEEKISEKITEKIIENATDKDIDIDVKTDKDEGSITIKGDNGEEVTISGKSNEIPEDFPDDVFLIEGESESGGVIKSEKAAIYNVSIITDKDIKAVVAEINKKMTENGWQQNMNMTTPDGGMLMYSKENKSASIILDKKDDKTQATYSVSINKE